MPMGKNIARCQNMYDFLAQALSLIYVYNVAFKSFALSLKEKELQAFCLINSSNESVKKYSFIFKFQ